MEILIELVTIVAQVVVFFFDDAATSAVFIAVFITVLVTVFVAFIVAIGDDDDGIITVVIQARAFTLFLLRIYLSNEGFLRSQLHGALAMVAVTAVVACDQKECFV